MRVLVTSDGSGHSVSVLYHAQRLGEAFAGDLVFMRILDPVVDCAGVRSTSLEEAARTVAGEWEAEMRDRLESMRIPGRVRVVRKVHAEEIPAAILRVAGEEDADVVAMASRGSGLLRHALLGSTALGVLSHADTPLLLGGDAITRPQATDRYHVLVAIDDSEDSVRALDALLGLGPSDRLDLTLLQVHQPRLADEDDATEIARATARLDDLASRVTGAGSVRTVVLPQDHTGIVGLILETADRLGAAAITMATHGHGRAYRVFMGSTAMGLLQRSPLPLLVVRSKR